MSSISKEILDQIKEEVRGGLTDMETLKGMFPDISGRVIHGVIMSITKNPLGVKQKAVTKTVSPKQIPVMTSNNNNDHGFRESVLSDDNDNHSDNQGPNDPDDSLQPSEETVLDKFVQRLDVLIESINQLTGQIRALKYAVESDDNHNLLKKR